ncbi:MAG: DUF308 domain-containing protein [Bacteroidales bacterium]|nr:DUF308 domain-containing protein [Bacteroidales bacterium]MBQ5748066.1 DUF308 domain-containing protein [Bacteroidales bacterium]MBQ5882657.1 DUF308 domain-containing protein [Bacteroidales bacterium]
MNLKYNSIIAFVAGLILIIWPEIIKEYIVLIIGGLILSVGVASLIYYFIEKEKGNVSNILLLNAAVDSLFGLILLIFPKFFAGLVMFLFGIVLLLFGISRLVKLIQASKVLDLHWGLYLVPSLTTLAGVLLFFYPNRTGNLLFIIFGIILLAYSISDFVSMYIINKKTKEANALKESVNNIETEGEEKHLRGESNPNRENRNL